MVGTLIDTYKITRGSQPGTLRIVNGKSLPADVVAELKARKAEIITELDRRDAEREAAREAELDAYRTGVKKFRASWYDGEILQGWMVMVGPTDMLEDIGLGRYVEGWGYHIPAEAVKALGEEFTLAAAAEYMRPALDAKAVQVAKIEAARRAAFAEARETGKPVVLRSWTEECNDPREECSLDIVTEYALPSGSTKITRQHTW